LLQQAAFRPIRFAVSWGFIARLPAIVAISVEPRHSSVRIFGRRKKAITGTTAMFVNVRLALLLIAAPSLGLGAPPADPSEAQIRSALEGMHQAASALDADRFMSWYLHDPSLTITFDGHSLSGWDAILQQQRRWWAGYKSKPAYVEDKPPQIRLLAPDVATTLQWMTVGGGDATDTAKSAHLVVTSVWKKYSEGWRIVVAHESFSQ
jgi:uncharacterized protein (TIGR02246 family)